jgi:alkanesulfonate monooxygenase SsuD/methylene tetrahydromethanopterin reductase-like flavin-dependent oxidoreductase (luciferase family)
VARRAAAIGRGVEEMRGNGGIVGTSNEVVDIIGRYREAGATRLYLQTLDVSDLNHVELVATAVAPQLS